MKFTLGFLSIKTIIIALLLVFLGFQAWLFLSPKPRNYTPAEIASAQNAVDQVKTLLLQQKGNEKDLRLGVIHLLNDPNDKITTLLKATLDSEPHWQVEKGSLIVRFLDELFHSITNATSWDEIVNAGRRVELDIIVAGKITDIQPVGDGAQTLLEINIFDVKDGKWLFQQTVQGKWEPTPIQKAQNAIDKNTALLRTIPLLYRILIWMSIVLALPWVTAFLTQWAVAKKSNGASVAILITYLFLLSIVGGLLFGFAISGFFHGLIALASLVLSMFYSYWCCEKIAERTRE